MHKYNFENATEKRVADKELGHILIPNPDGQVKHPEHLQQHETLQILQREALNENWSVLRKMITELPEYQRKDTILRPRPWKWCLRQPLKLREVMLKNS